MLKYKAFNMVEQSFPKHDVEITKHPEKGALFSISVPIKDVDAAFRLCALLCPLYKASLCTGVQKVPDYGGGGWGQAELIPRQTRTRGIIKIETADFDKTPCGMEKTITVISQRGVRYK